MLEDAKIENTSELEFAVFCIENIAIRLEKNAEEVYKMLTEESNILSGYIIPEYEMLHTKYTRIIECFAEKENLSLDDALSVFYHSKIYRLISEGVSDLHCMSDEYLTEELITEYKEK